MFTKEPFIKSLKQAPFYKVACQWIKKYSNPSELSEVKLRHPQYKGTLLNYYIDQAAVIYVRMKGFYPEEIQFLSRSIHFNEGEEYNYRPLSKVPLLGALWCTIAADDCRFTDDKIKASKIMEQLSSECAFAGKELRDAVSKNLPDFDNFYDKMDYMIEEVEISLHPESHKELLAYFSRMQETSDSKSSPVIYAQSVNINTNFGPIDNSDKVDKSTKEE